MENKYYTPQNWEFCVGLEYERYTSEVDSVNTTWVKGVYDEEDLAYGFLYPEVRVKCIDKEDIESSGWDYIKTSKSGSDHFVDKEYGMHELVFDYRNNRAVIKMYFPERSAGHTAFLGNLKNKSQLKTIMKYIGIKTK